MTTDLHFYDASEPPATPPPGMDGVAFYIGGDTPHVWTLAEINAQPVRFRLPIYVRSNPQQVSADADAALALARLAAIGAPKGTLLALDSETSVDPNYVAQFYYAIKNGGYTLIDYGSRSTLFGNDVPDGYYWGADWTDQEHILPETQMTQWVSRGTYDESTALPALPFWDTRSPITSPIPRGSTVTFSVSMPVLATGAGMPPAPPNSDVKTLQGLLEARGFSVGASGIDGRFGHDTYTAVVALQAYRHRTDAAFLIDGIAGQQTWPAAMGR